VDDELEANAEHRDGVLLLSARGSSASRWVAFVLHLPVPLHP
jgi:hypothetical protein